MPLRARSTASGFDPDLIVAIGTGGFIPARILKTYLKKPIFTVGISYYGPDNVPAKSPHTIQWIDEVEKKLAGKRVLLVDEVDDSRVTLEYCLQELLHHGPAEIAVAVLHNKKKEKKGRIPPRSAATLPARSWTTSGSATPGMRRTSRSTRRSRGPAS